MVGRRVACNKAEVMRSIHGATVNNVLACQLLGCSSLKAIPEVLDEKSLIDRVKNVVAQHCPN